jgi:integral membrane protein
VPTQRPLDEVTARAAFARFRFAAIAEGIALLILVGIMVMRYVVYGGDPWWNSTSDLWSTISSRWSPIHGVIYMIYVVLGFDLWVKMRWRIPRMVLIMFFGVIPVLSFFGERFLHSSMEEDLRRRPTLQDSADGSSAEAPVSTDPDADHGGSGPADGKVD